MRKEETQFELKKKSYAAPNLKKYGSYHEYTKGTVGGGTNADNLTYYTGLEDPS